MGVNDHGKAQLGLADQGGLINISRHDQLLVKRRTGVADIRAN